MRIIIGIILCLFLMQASATWAAPNPNCHSRYSYSLDAGNTSVDVAYQDEIVLTWVLPVTENQNNDYSARVSETYGHFACEIEHFHKTGQPSGRNCLTATVSWEPGTDSSGCFVDILKDGNTVRRAELYMNYY